MEPNNQQRTFNGILNQVAARNAVRLMQRARTANRLAKTLSGKPRKNAYRVKTSALVTLSVRFPDQVSVTLDRHAPNFVLVRNARARFALHAPARNFAGGQE